MQGDEMKGKKALVIGLAKSGVSAANLLSKLGAQVTVTDIKSNELILKNAESLPKEVELKLGGHESVEIDSYDLAVISPGVPWDSAFALFVREAGVEMISEMELAFRYLKAPVIAITGSNGKSTTTTMIDAMLKAGGFKTFVGGNLDTPVCEAVGGDFDWIVAEVSSFQLEGIDTFRPKIALVLNITSDHLDRHKTVENYASIKGRIAENMGELDTLIVNGSDPLACKINTSESVNVIPSSGSPLLRFGGWFDGDIATLSSQGMKVTMFSKGDLLLPGKHNLENGLAAAIAAVVAGVKPLQIADAIKSYNGLPHRMEIVGKLNGVTYINDSKGTNVDATIMSLSSFDKNVVLIAGGSSKGAGFSALATAVKTKTKGAVLIGETAPDIEKALGEFKPLSKANDMGEAVSLATSFCGIGETVMLSPACASFDMFENYMERGDAFKEAVAGLKETEMKNAG